MGRWLSIDEDFLEDYLEERFEEFLSRLSSWQRTVVRSVVSGVGALGAASVVAAGVVLVLALAWPFVLAGVWEHVRAAVETPARRAAVVFVLLMLAVGLHMIRARFRSAYGLAEVAVGLAACWVALQKADVGGLAIGLTLASGVYVMVRGLDNVAQGRVKQVKAAARGRGSHAARYSPGEEEEEG
jgi:hypothetical protein